MNPSQPASSRATAAGSRWDPSQYLKYDQHRLRPALDLLGRIPVPEPRSVVDLGCGAGNVTRILSERWPAARIVGLDVSAQMLERAAGTPGRIEWLRADIQGWQPPADLAGSVDVLYSNATLQWLDDHERLFVRLLGHVPAGGCLAVQMPVSYDNDSHRLMRETWSALEAEGVLGSEPGQASVRAAVMRRNVLGVDEYFRLLRPLAAELDIWQTEYLQQLSGTEAVFEWVKATALRPVLNGLQGTALERFVERYRGLLLEAYPPGPDDITLYPFKRLFMVVTRSRGPGT
ncbi:MAG: methyltransferase domain-containing protein [Gammaproteobacteria bacterium]|nr:methyltransferase domain-containing protein [Gammaproteobacteria bacterium]